MTEPGIVFREAWREDVPAVMSLLLDDSLGATRELIKPDLYFAAFDSMKAENTNTLIVGELRGEIVATYQLTFITGLSHRATRRAQVESVRIASHLRGKGFGHAMMADAEERARSAGCGMIQLTTDATRTRARAFYDSLGYKPSHVGYKHRLD